MLFDDINKQNKYYQVWNDIFKIINKGQGELKLHEKFGLYDSDLPIKQVFKIHSITVVIKSLIEKNNANEAFFFDSFGKEHIPKEINKLINNDMTKPSSLKRIKSNIFRIQAYDSIMCGYFCIEFINYMVKGKTLLDHTNLFSPNNFKKNDQIIKRIFKNE